MMASQLLPPRPMRLHLEYLTGIKGFLSLLRDPNKVDSVFEIVEGFADTAIYRQAIAYVRSFPENAPLFDERHLAGPIDLQRLLLLPAGSLGREFAATMLARKLDPDFFPKVDVKDDVTYLMLRLRQTHDLWHLVTGFDVDVPGELGLQAFGLAQLHNPLAVALIAGGLLRTLSDPSGLDRVMNQIARGWEMGRAAKQLFAQKWEQGWDKPLKIWREELDVYVQS